MARIRTIKPEFVESESVGKLSRDARLLFVLLWTFVDDDGRARASSRLLASRLYPYDDDAADMIDAWMAELEQGGHVRLYEVDGDSYLDIPKWLKHQKIDHPSKSRLPEFRDDFAKPRETIAPHTLDLGPSTKDLGPSAAEASEKRAKLEEVEAAFEEFTKAATECGWPKPRALEADRRKKLAARLAEHGLDGWRQALANARASDFLRTKFALKLDWVLEPKNFRKVLEGNYGTQCATVAQTQPEEAQWRARVRGWRPGKFWKQGDWGPPPGEPGCLVPAAVLADWKLEVMQ